MSNNKQSSVEFIINNLHLKDSLKWAEIIAEAKAMHKEETIDFAFSWSHERASRIDVEKDYNKTFNNMSNNKLYTEEQVIALTKAAFAAVQYHNPFIFEEELKSITPIELPSDEEIAANGYRTEEYNEVWIGGANFVLDKIKGGNNEQQ